MVTSGRALDVLVGAAGTGKSLALSILGRNCQPGPTSTEEAEIVEPRRTSARPLWEAIEPLHAVVYFAPEPAQAAKALGLPSWWDGLLRRPRRSLPSARSTLTP